MMKVSYHAKRNREKRSSYRRLVSQKMWWYLQCEHHNTLTLVSVTIHRSIGVCIFWTDTISWNYHPRSSIPIAWLYKDSSYSLWTKLIEYEVSYKVVAYQWWHYIHGTLKNAHYNAHDDDILLVLYIHYRIWYVFSDSPRWFVNKQGWVTSRRCDSVHYRRLCVV